MSASNYPPLINNFSNIFQFLSSDSIALKIEDATLLNDNDFEDEKHIEEAIVVKGIVDAHSYPCCPTPGNK